MANGKQLRGTTTNLAKLVGWDIDLYNSFNDAPDCIVCLSDRDKYVLGQALIQCTWDTRWTSEVGTPTPDINTISWNLEQKMSQYSCIDLCIEVLSCIENNDDVRNAITNLALASNNSESTRDYGQSQANLSLSNGENPLCNQDMWFGGIQNAILQAHINNNDCLEILEVTTNINEFVTIIIGGGGGGKSQVLSSIANWALYVQNSISENYDAQFTQAYYDEVCCDLRCITAENCELTPQDIVDYFYGRLSSVLTYQSLFEETLEFLIFGTWSGTEIVDFMMLSQFAFRGQFGKWFRNIGFNDVVDDIVLGFNDANNDWIILCDECPSEWESILDFTSSDYGFTFVDGQWIDGVGIIPTGNTGNDNRLYATLSIDQANITYVSWNASITIVTNPQGTSTAGLSIKLNSNNEFAQPYNYPSDTPIGTTNLDFTADIDIQGDFIDLFLRPDNDGTTGDGVVTEVVLRGFGTKPTQLP